MPVHPIYVPLLPKDAQDVIAQVHESTKNALKLLERENFSFQNEVDIFEAGRRLDDANLTPVAEDAFTGGGLLYSFERRRSGDVIGFYVANGRTRDVRFTRVR